MFEEVDSGLLENHEVGVLLDVKAMYSFISIGVWDAELSLRPR